MSETDSKPAENRSAARIIARNTVFGVGAQMALRVVSFAFQVIVVNTLGDSNFGQYSIVLAWAGLFSVIGDLGINQYLAREIARDRDSINAMFWDVVSLRFVLAILAATITTVGAVLNGYATPIVIGIVIYTGSYFIQAILAPLNSILIGSERVDVHAIMTVVTQVLFMIFAGLFLFMGLDFIWIVIASVINLPIVLALNIWFIRRNKLGSPAFNINPRMWWSVLKAGLPFGFIQLSLSFAFRVDTVMLSGQVSDSAVGWYNAAYNLTLTLLTVARSFNDAILPTLAREHAIDAELIKPWYFRSVKVIVFIGLPIAVGGMLTAHQITGILYPQMPPIAVVLAILVWDIPFAMYHSFCGNLTTSMRRERSAARIYGSLGIINIAVNLVLIPRFGILGAAFATVLTDLVGAAQFYFLFRRELGYGLGFTRLVRLGFAALVMGGLILIIGHLNFFLIVPAAAITYLIFVWRLGAFSEAELAGLTRVVSRRLVPLYHNVIRR